MNNTIRYNISINDGRKRKSGGISLFRLDGILSDIKIYNNTIISSKSSYGDYSAFKSLDKGIKNVEVYNNIFYTLGDIYSVFIINDKKEFKFLRNNYYSDSGKNKIFHNGKSFDSVKKWAKSTNNEIIDRKFIALLNNPLLTITNVQNLYLITDYQGYFKYIKLPKSSVNIDSGLNLEDMLGINPGNKDYFSNSIPFGKGYDIGAHEWRN